MPSRTASARRLGSALLAAALWLQAGPARASQWMREEWAGFHANTAAPEMKLLDGSIYYSRWGLGVGTHVFDLKYGAWDVRRVAAHDASAHALTTFFPLNAYAALWSWKGAPYVHVLDSRKADRSIGRVEVYGSYCPWGTLWGFTEAVPDILGSQTRQNVQGSVRARVLDYGVRFDPGSWMAFSVGRLEFKTDGDAVFRARSYGRVYADASLYFGAASGDEYGGGLWVIPADLWGALKELFGASDVVTKRRLKRQSAPE